jgi:hypothetical protein
LIQAFMVAASAAGLGAADSGLVSFVAAGLALVFFLAAGFPNWAKAGAERKRRLKQKQIKGRQVRQERCTIVQK